MSLKIWLPLNGNTNNQGLLDANLGITSTSFVDGKFGKSLQNGQVIIPAAKAAEVLNNKAITIAFWIYVNADTGSSNKSMLFGTESMGANNNRKFSLFQYPTCNDLHWSWMNDEASTTFTSGIITGTLPSYKWTHVAITYENPNGCVYINGKLQQTFSSVSNSSSFVYDTTMIHNSVYHMFNDYRIYDNALSAKEVKLLSHGMICHYPLNGSGKQPENLVKGCYSCTSTNKEFKETDINKVAITLTTDDFIKNKGRTLCFSYNVKSNGDYTHGKECFPSSGVRFGVHTSFSYIDTSGNSKNNYYPLAELLDHGHSEGLYYTKWTPPTDIKEVTNFSLAIQTSPHSGFAYPAENNTEEWYLKDIKLEWGNKPTSWCPNKQDDLYSTWGYDDNTEYDTSGFNNHGTATALTLNQNSPRYKYCYGFNGNGQYIKTTNPLNSTSKEFSIACWVKFSDATTQTIYTARTAVGCGIAIFLIDSCLRLDDNTQTKFDDYSMTNHINNWTHMCITRDSTSKKLYINGKLVSNKNSVGDLQNISKNGTIGGSESSDNGVATSNWLNGSISDFRIYATALSAQDIQELYNTPVSLSNTGTLMTQGEFIEE